MITTWHTWSDELLAKCERMNLPWWAVTAVAYLVGYHISEFLLSDEEKS